METEIFIAFFLFNDKQAIFLSKSVDCCELTFCWHSNPVQVASELLGDVRLSSGW